MSIQRGENKHTLFIRLYLSGLFTSILTPKTYSFLLFNIFEPSLLSRLLMWVCALKNVNMRVPLMVHRWQGGDGGFLWVSMVYYSFHLSLFESSPPDPSQLLANPTNTSHIPLLSSCNLPPYAWFCITLMFNHHYTHCVCMSPCFCTKILILPAKWGLFFF